MLILQGLSVAAVIMLCLNLLTIQGPTIYNVSAAACHLLRSERRRTLGPSPPPGWALCCIGGMYEMLIPFLVLLGVYSAHRRGDPRRLLVRPRRALSLLQNARLRVLTGWDSAPTPPARWWPIFRRGSRRWWGSPSPRWSISS